MSGNMNNDKPDMNKEDNQNGNGNGNGNGNSESGSHGPLLDSVIFIKKLTWEVCAKMSNLLREQFQIVEQEQRTVLRAILLGSGVTIGLGLYYFEDVLFNYLMNRVSN